MAREEALANKAAEVLIDDRTGEERKLSEWTTRFQNWRRKRALKRQSTGAVTLPLEHSTPSSTTAVDENEGLQVGRPV
jgi:hypothetical protein